MKKWIVLVVVLLAATFAASCVPEKPQDVQPYCRNSYEAMLAEYPDYPHAFIGACVSYFETGKVNAFKSLCGNESFRLSLEVPGIETKQECIQYIKSLQP